MGVDSEGALVNGRHRLVLIAASTSAGEGVTLHEPEGIASEDALEFLGRLPELYPARRLVVYAGRYDVTQWLAGVARYALRELWRDGSALWHRPGKSGAPRYSLRLVDGHSFGVWREPWTSRVRIADVHGLFGLGTRFVEACAAWGVELPEIVERGKASRGELEAWEPGELAAYCLAECRALAELMERVAAKGHEVGVRPAGGAWGGAGALAAALLRKHGAKGYVRPTVRQDVGEAALTAYYGGRVDMTLQGECERVLAVDMRSAYPWALASAPSMIGGWLASRFEPAEPFALWHVRRFDSPPLRALTPLPVRTPDRVTYPGSGAGWYHAVEVAAAIRAGAELEIEDGFVYRPAVGEPEAPWAWLREVYAQRAELRAAGDTGGEQLVKVALNAVYGKIAQSVGEAPYQCFELAGYVTACVRAAMLDAAGRAPSRVIGIHTDGLLFDATGAELELGLELGGELGQWEAHEGERLLIVQPGVYTYDEPGVGAAVSRRIAGRQRGVAERGLSWERVEHEWRAMRSGGRITLPHEMHHGLGTCYGRRRWGSLGQWVTETRTVSFAATSRFPSSSWSGGLQTMLPVAWSGPAIPYEPRPPDADEQLRREQPAE